LTAIKTPGTEDELERWMKENCYNFNNYSINGNFISEGFGIDRSGSLFSWYYTERGEKNILKYFQSESEIAAYAFHQIKSDKWARTHCIGFTTSIDEKSELEAILRNMGIAYFQDTIPYYGPEQPAYRTFVSGCAITQTIHLKDKYYRQR